MSAQTCGQMCACHPLAHAISAVIARYDAPIPRPSLRSVIDELRDALAESEDDAASVPAPRRETQT